MAVKVAEVAGGIRTTGDALVMLPDSVLTAPIGFLARYRRQPITGI